MPRGAGGDLDAGARPAPFVSAKPDPYRGGVLSGAAREPDRCGAAVTEGAAEDGGVPAGVRGDRYRGVVQSGGGGVGKSSARRGDGGISGDQTAATAAMMAVTSPSVV